jgi:oligopeptide/dipeptide ABC transporter ATP-binding protein
MAENILVMYAGREVEYAPAAGIFREPKHPYTIGLLRSIPRLDEDVESLQTIAGVVPNQYEMPTGCRFRPRCPDAMPQCGRSQPDLYRVGEARVACFKYAQG